MFLVHLDSGQLSLSTWLHRWHHASGMARRRHDAAWLGIYLFEHRARGHRR